MTIRAVSALCILTNAAAPMNAQRADALRPTPSRLYVSVFSQDTVHRQNAIYNWQESALITGAIVGSLSGLVSVAFCGDFDNNNYTPVGQCPVHDVEGFLIGAALGGTIAAVITASPTPPRVPAGYEVHGNRGRYGAFMLGVPSFGVMVLGVKQSCHSSAPFAPSGCSAGSIAGSLAMVAVNAAIGYLVGKGIPALRRISAAP